MIPLQTLDQLERDVTIAELKADTIEGAFHVDDGAVASTEKLASVIGRCLEDVLPSTRSSAVAQLFALKVRVSAALDRMCWVKSQCACRGAA
jgi:hypothetical protein